MSMHDLQTAFELIRDNPHYGHFSGLQPPERVRHAEGALEVDFPPTYREFIAHLGSGGIGSAEFYGVVSDDFAHASVPNGIWLTLRHRNDRSIPDDFIIVGSTGDGGYYAIDTAKKDAHGESPVVEWWPGLTAASGNGRKVAEDFGAFFLEEIRQALDRARSRS